MSDSADNGTVRYTVKELLGRLDHKLDELNEKIEGRYALLEARVATLETQVASSNASTGVVGRLLQWAIPILVGLGIALSDRI